MPHTVWAGLFGSSGTAAARGGEGIAKLCNGGDWELAKVAIATGGTRGTGAAMSKAINAVGHEVAAVCAGNDEAAKTFRLDTGIATHKWDVSSLEACIARIAQVDSDLRLINILVNNAGTTRDCGFHKRRWNNGRPLSYQLQHSVQHGEPRNRRHVRAGIRRTIYISSINAQKGQFGPANYSAAKAGMSVSRRWPGKRQEEDHGGRNLPWIHQGVLQKAVLLVRHCPARHARLHHPPRRLPGRRGGRIRHWIDAVDQRGTVPRPIRKARSRVEPSLLKKNGGALDSVAPSLRGASKEA
ncbi:SDR family NAD(P)-dependent oxidoreductase [Mesorhizobium sp. M0026]